MSSNSTSNSRAAVLDPDRRLSLTEQQLVDAIRSGNLENLRALLALQKGRRSAATDKDIHKALCVAAEVGSVESCRLIWGRLSDRGKQKYFADWDDCLSLYSPLRHAVENGHFEVVRLLVDEFHFNVNQRNFFSETPLYYATRNSLEMTRLLLDAGADPNGGGSHIGPIGIAVDNDNTELVQLLLQRGAAANRSRNNANVAIQKGNLDMLRLLLQHGGNLDEHSGAIERRIRFGTITITALNVLLRNQRQSRDVKLSISRFLVEYTSGGHPATASLFLQTTLDTFIKGTENEHCALLFEAGMDPRVAMYSAIQAAVPPVVRLTRGPLGARRSAFSNNGAASSGGPAPRRAPVALCHLLVHEFHIDPFLVEQQSHHQPTEQTTSPFHAAACLADTSIFEYFLSLWNERFASSGGKNGDGKYPIHVVCCDPRVSLQAIQLLVNRQADTVLKADGEQGFLPFHVAAMSDISLNIIFFLLRHCPSALNHHHVGNAVATPAVLGTGMVNGSSFPVVETTNDDNEEA